MQITLPSAKSVVVDHALLRRVLIVDGTVSALSGVGLILAAEPIARFANVSSTWIVEGIGVVCLVFALFVGLTVRQVPMKRNWASLVIVLNGAGVLLCDVALLFDPLKLSTDGKLGLLTFAIGMAILGTAEWFGLRRGQRL